MTFNSLEFAVFFAVCLALYLPLPQRAQNRLLLVASYVFYGAWDWRFLGLLVLSTSVDWILALSIAASESPRVRRALVVASVVTNLGILGTFKYAGFFADGLRQLLAPLGVALPPLAFDIVLPVGVSFYTFQSLGYIIDVYRRQVAPCRNPLDFALFISFFPQLVAGPIERAAHMLPQFFSPRAPSAERMASGGWLVLWGIFKKAVVADNLGHLVDAVYASGGRAPTGLEVLVAAYAFTLQIYCDFSGYSDVARGTARILGFDLMVNFRLPFLARSPAEFWRRWHVSLSSWLRDYLYIPLGGNRGSARRTYRNLLVTMVLGGVWHGANWTFIVWGAFHGLWLALHRALAPRLARAAPGGGPARAAWELLCGLVTFHGVCLGFVFFRADSLGQACDLLRTLVSAPAVGSVPLWLVPLALYTLPLAGVEAWQAWRGDEEPSLPLPVPARAFAYALVLLAIVVLGEDFGAPFIYFQF